MNGAFYIGATGLDAQQRALDVVANNLANINTTGFKRSAVRFSELVAAPDIVDGDDQRPLTGMDGVAIVDTPKIWTQGDLRQTGHALDIAIDGNGFLQIMGPAGRTLLWRGGTMKVNADGYLATADGLPLQALISVPGEAKSVTISPDGTVSAQLDGEQDLRSLGKLDIAIIDDPAMLSETAGGYFETSDPSRLIVAQAGEEGAGLLKQGVLEGANLQLSEEMIQLMLVQRAYAANAQVVQAGDQLMSIANELRRGA